MKQVRAELISRAADVDIDTLVGSPHGANGWFGLAAGLLTGYDSVLRPVGSLRVDVSADARLLAATDDLGNVAVAQDENLVLFSGQTELRLDCPGGDSAVFLSPDLLLVTAPEEDLGWGGHEVLLIDVRAGEVLDRHSLEELQASVSALPHPSDGSILLDAGEGQDGSYLFRVTVSERALTVEELAENVVPAGFDPSGKKLLLVPHPSFQTQPSIVAWPDMEPLAEIDPEAVLGEDDYFHFFGGFLSETHVLLETIPSCELVLCSDELEPRARITLPGYEAPRFEIESIMILGQNAFATRLWSDAAAITAVWRLT